VSVKPILVVNAGSSSLKLGLYSSDARQLWDGSTEGIGADDLERAVDEAEAKTGLRPAIVGHRVVHGGPSLVEHQRITPEVKSALRSCEQFAPLHVPIALRLIEAAEKLLPDAVQVACFDTVFHRTLPEVAWHLPLPDRWPGVRRYGFHGLSYESIVAQLDPVPARLVVAHLGSGASLCAIANGRSIDTTMGLTPTGGIPMATRTGDLDPGVLVYLMRQGLDADAIEKIVDHEGGLQALGGEHDMKKLIASDSRLAIDAFCTAVAKTIAGSATVLGGLDLVVFTGGIGEHAQRIRDEVCRRIAVLGDVPTRVLPAEEDLQIARHCARLATS
jgi:acetate kinase